VNDDDAVPPPKKKAKTATSADPAVPTEATEPEPAAQTPPPSRNAQRRERIRESNAQRAEVFGADGPSNIKKKW
jgi:hypothetical protein